MWSADALRPDVEELVEDLIGLRRVQTSGGAEGTAKLLRKHGEKLFAPSALRVGLKPGP